jgi:hypothetical protein
MNLQLLCALISFRGMNCLHVLAAHCKENTQAIFEILLKYHSTFPLDIQDGLGNTGKLFYFFLERFVWK